MTSKMDFRQQSRQRRCVNCTKIIYGSNAGEELNSLFEYFSEDEECQWSEQVRYFEALNDIFKLRKGSIVNLSGDELMCPTCALLFSNLYKAYREFIDPAIKSNSLLHKTFLQLESDADLEYDMEEEVEEEGEEIVEEEMPPLINILPEQEAKSKKLNSSNHFKCPMCTRKFPTQEALALHSHNLRAKSKRIVKTLNTQKQNESSFDPDHEFKDLPNRNSDKAKESFMKHIELAPVRNCSELAAISQNNLNSGIQNEIVVQTSIKRVKPISSSKPRLNKVRRGGGRKKSAVKPPKMKISYNCSPCAIGTFSSKKEYEKHMKEVHSEMISCKECSLKLPSRESLAKHITQAHSKLKSFVCSFPECAKVFDSSWGKYKHEKGSHEYYPKYECNMAECRKKFKLMSEFNIHKISHFQAEFEEKKSIYECDQCSRRFIRSSNLVNHIKLAHSEIRRFLCTFEYCKTRFSEPGFLEIHERIHYKGLGHVCGVCKRAFSSGSLLQDHKMFHLTKEEAGKVKGLLICSCGKRFFRKSHLYIHTKVMGEEGEHTGDVSYDQAALDEDIFCGLDIYVDASNEEQLNSNEDEQAVSNSREINEPETQTLDLSQLASSQSPSQFQYTQNGTIPSSVIISQEDFQNGKLILLNNIFEVSNDLNTPQTSTNAYPPLEGQDNLIDPQAESEGDPFSLRSGDLYDMSQMFL